MEESGAVRREEGREGGSPHWGQKSVLAASNLIIGILNLCVTETSQALGDQTGTGLNGEIPSSRKTPHPWRSQSNPWSLHPHAPPSARLKEALDKCCSNRR